MATDKRENKEKKIAFSKEGDLVVKNKKFKKSDIFAFCVCIVAALIIWLYATNVEINRAKEFENLQGELKSTQIG